MSQFTIWERDTNPKLPQQLKWHRHINRSGLNLAMGVNKVAKIKLWLHLYWNPGCLDGIIVDQTNTAEKNNLGNTSSEFWQDQRRHSGSDAALSHPSAEWGSSWAEPSRTTRWRKLHNLWVHRSQLESTLNRKHMFGFFCLPSNPYTCRGCAHTSVHITKTRAHYDIWWHQGCWNKCNNNISYMHSL